MTDKLIEQGCQLGYMDGPAHLAAGIMFCWKHNFISGTGVLISMACAAVIAVFFACVSGEGGGCGD